MRLLVHIAGEADLLLSSRDASDEVRAERISARRAELATALTGPGGAKAAHRLLTEGTWPDEVIGTPAPSPLLGALGVLAARDGTPDLAVVVLGTNQNPPHRLDTLPIARSIVEVLNGLAAEDDAYPVRSATALEVVGLVEEPVVTALSGHLGEAPGYRQALLTWGSGSTAMALGALTALSHAGLPWQLVLTNNPAGDPVVDPLDRLDVDPVVGVLVRWRMFAALAGLASENTSAVQLTIAQHDLVRRAADRHRAGFEAQDSASLRAVLADAVVRRDGSASLAVRRYITSRYEELLAIDKADHPRAEDLLRKYEKPAGGPPLGRKLGDIKRHRDDDPAIRASIDLPSYKWLYGPVVNSLQNIGRGSHRLRQPAACDARVVGDYLSRYDTDGTGWQNAGLPEPPVTPASTVLAVWSAGVRRNNARPGAETEPDTVGRQLSKRGLPGAVRNYIGLDEPPIRAVIFGVDDGQGSRDLAEADADRIRAVTDKTTGEPIGAAWVEWIGLTGIDPAVVERSIESRLTREVAALLLIPTGTKPAVLALLRAMRRIGARRGIPLFVREVAKPATADTYKVHLWPALTGGDLPLLNAAREALHNLELDVAWRLLAASAIDPKVTDQARRLAATFASRKPLQGPEEAPAVGQETDWKMGLIAQRLELVEAALAHVRVSADRIRLLVLAADAMEASVAATQESGRPGSEYGAFRTALGEVAKRGDRSEAWPERVLLLLNAARDRAPITHGSETDPDAVVAEAASRLAGKWKLNPADAAALPSDVPTLLRRAIAAAATRGHGQPNQPDSLLRVHEEILTALDAAIGRRRMRGNG